MCAYISSNANRFYAALETSYGQAAPVTAAQRIPAMRLRAHQNLQTTKRLDKTGTRTFAGTAASAPRLTSFELSTYLTSWNASMTPFCATLLEAGLGATGNLSSGLVVSSAQSSTQFQTFASHNLATGSGVSVAGELRFVTNVVDSTTFTINAPYATTPPAGTAFAPTFTYRLSTALPSFSLYDYWDPTTAISRVLTGAAIDSLEISIGGDLFELVCRGPAADLLDSNTFLNGVAGLAAFPPEPPLADFEYSLVPGNLGEAWLGGAHNQFFTLTAASVAVRNNTQTRGHDYGSAYPRAIRGGEREVLSDFTLFAQDDAQTLALYSAAKNRTPVPAMLQLGQQSGQIMAIYLPNVLPELPLYDDSQTRLLWKFNNNLAQGTADDEIVIALA